MGLVLDIVNDIRTEIAVDDKVLKAGRERRDLVAKAATGLEGSLRWFRSGSVAHGTTNKPMTDADAGTVLDRRSYPTLGPDGEDEGPTDVVDAICELIGPLVRKEYPNAKINRSRRCVYVTFGAPLATGEDPTVDLIPTLTRKDGDGLWIPDLDNDDWSASHPEKHTELFTGGAQTRRTQRARVTRLAKAWNKQWEKDNRALSSFNIEALVWEFVDDGVVALDLAEALAGWFRYAHDEIEKGLTKDPAGVSAPIKLLLKKETVLTRLDNAAGRFERALDNEDDEEVVKDALSGVYFKYVEAPKQSKSDYAAALRTGNKGVGATKSGIALGSGAALKTTRSYGEEGRDG